jgi:hypothetical protein
MDGGTVWNTDLKDAIDRCLEMVEDEEHIVLDIAITEYVYLPVWEKPCKTLTNFIRSKRIKSYQHKLNDITEFAKSRPNVNYRHFFKPQHELGSHRQELKFGNETTWKF